MNLLTAGKLTGLFKRGAEISHFRIGTCIEFLDKFARGVRVGHVYNGYGYVADNLVIVYPRVEKRIEQRDENAENEETFVAELVLYFLYHDVACIGNALPYVV